MEEKKWSGGRLHYNHLGRQLPGFNKYFKQLSERSSDREEMNPRNPWYTEYYETYCNCSNKEEVEDLNITTCPFKNKRPKRIHQVQQPYIHFVRDAVYVFAHALHNLWKDTCNNTQGMCPGFQEKAFHQLKDYLHDVNFLILICFH
jgi:metabotropic X receptor